MNNSYFSDRETGAKPRIKEDINTDVLDGIFSIIDSLIDIGSFGIEFPAVCPDGLGIIGTDSIKFSLAVRAEIPDLPWPIRPISTSTWPSAEPAVPSTLSILDFIEFCHRNIAQPVKDTHHKFFNHYHLDFNRVKGQVDFRQKINRILARNGLVYELQEDGQIIRLAPPVLREVLLSTTFTTGDSELNDMLEVAKRKFLDPDTAVRRESLEKLWDAWERLKTIFPGKDKKVSIGKLLEKASPGTKFRDMLDKEARELTEIGNTFQIRHSEIMQVPVEFNEHIDYLFHRLFAMIQLILRKK